MSRTLPDDVENALPAPEHIHTLGHSECPSTSIHRPARELTANSRIRRLPERVFSHPSSPAASDSTKSCTYTWPHRLFQLVKKVLEKHEKIPGDARAARSFRQWCLDLSSEDAEETKQNDRMASQEQPMRLNTAKELTKSGVENTDMERVRRPRRLARSAVYCLLFCWPGTANELVSMSMVPIPDPQDDVEMFERLQKKWYQIKGRWRMFIPFHGVVEVKEVEVFPSYERRKHFKAKFEELSPQERDDMSRELPGLKAAREVIGDYDCDCEAYAPGVDCHVCKIARYECTLIGTLKLPLLTTCFYEPQTARETRLSESLLFSYRGQSFPLLCDATRISETSSYLDRRRPAYMIRTGWHAPYTWLMWIWTVVLLAILPLPIWIAISRMTDHQVQVSQLVVGLIALVVPAMHFRLPKLPD